VTTSIDLSYSARAELTDAISRGFSYPVSDFYADLVSGEFLQTMKRACEGVASTSPLVSALSEVEVGIGTIVTGRIREDLETEYIELFEHNRKQQPIHLYGGLYLQGEGGRLEILQRNIRRYRDYGLDMEDGAEHADHLTVVLEFLGLLYKQYARMLSEGGESGVEQLQTDMRNIVNELAWTRMLIEELVARGGHPFYLPLSSLLRRVLELQS
jgi:nitrate reductase assembly molybdenum cofactor insertion protein NarJ